MNERTESIANDMEMGAYFMYFVVQVVQLLLC